MDILRFLAEPQRMEFGATGSDISYNHRKYRGHNIDKVLEEMVEESLIERRIDAHDARAKPYFIAQSGKSWLNEATKLDAEFYGEERQGWSNRIRESESHHRAVKYLSELPELKHSDKRRIQEITRDIIAICASGLKIGE